MNDRPAAAHYYLEPALYDLVYADVAGDIAPHVAESLAAGGRVLEVCCGNGRLLIPALEAGVVCDGLDRERAMLDDLRAKLAAKRLSAELFEGDMRDFTLPRRYARVTIGFNSFYHNLTQDDQLATLRCCREHLEPDGSLQLAIFHPSVEKLMQWSGTWSLSKEVAVPGSAERLKVWDRADDDRVEQIRRMTRRLEWVTPDGAVRATRELAFDLRYAWKPEVELLLRVAGYKRWNVRPLPGGYGGAAEPEPERAIREGDTLLWTAWRD